MGALGAPQAILVLGGGSEIAQAIVKALPRSRLRRVVLAGRPSPSRQKAVDELTGLGLPGVIGVNFDARQTSDHGQVIDAIFDQGDIDLVILAFGVLGDQGSNEADPLLAVDVVTTNYTGAVSAGLHVARRLREQGHGLLIVLSSVAGDRARRSNFVYGSTKAGLDAFAQGLGDALSPSGVRVMIVRPGMVKTRMSEGLPEAPFTTDADSVARVVVKGLNANKPVVYAPRVLRYVMFVIKGLPRTLFRKMTL